MLEIGYNSRFEVRMERVPCAVSSAIRILYLSDLHFTKRSGEMAAKLAEAVNKLAPDLVLFGGDYVDTYAGLLHLDRLLYGISEVAPILAIAGNHDRFFGIKTVRELMTSHQVQWIEGASLDLELKDVRLRIDGAVASERDSGKAIRILCLHKPLDLKMLRIHYHLAFAGHLHGSQCVLWENSKGLFPGRWFYKWNRLKAMVDDCHYYISRGLGDTLPFRYNCPKEIIVVDLEPD